jgi:hypothetical protein
MLHRPLSPLDCHDRWVSFARGRTEINDRRDIVTSATQERSRVPFLSFTTWSLLAFGGGLALGIVGHASPAAGTPPVDVAFDPAVADAARRDRASAGRAGRIARTLLRPVKPLLIPVASRLLARFATRRQP